MGVVAAPPEAVVEFFYQPSWAIRLGKRDFCVLVILLNLLTLLYVFGNTVPMKSTWAGFAHTQQATSNKQQATSNKQQATKFFRPF
jgi:hypothetical protein